jgi:hypothetical protein
MNFHLVFSGVTAAVGAIAGAVFILARRSLNQHCAAERLYCGEVALDI